MHGAAVRRGLNLGAEHAAQIVEWSADPGSQIDRAGGGHGAGAGPDEQRLPQLVLQPGSFPLTAGCETPSQWAAADSEPLR
ncbi:hypothetical protein ACWGK6_26415 [Streptomyces violaceusniger]